jgi:single-strand selective monofunctional uracil DNA glycosylase
MAQRSATTLATLSRNLAETVDRLQFDPPVAFVYDPLVYARAPHEAYLERYGAGPKEALFLGMNPGPFGMAQTGVPFGDVAMVRDWMGIREPVSKPRSEHEKRPVLGFDCPRSEVSGARLWGWARDRFGAPERFFSRFFVANYCPLAFIESSGKNRTPDKLPASEREPLLEACDQALIELVKILTPRWVVGVGAFAADRARAALVSQSVRIGTILHPSPASPLANRGWAEHAERDLAALGISVP